MGEIEIEREMDVTCRWSPCVICEKRTSCEYPCLRFGEYIETDSVRNRYKKFKRFAEKRGVRL